MRWPGIWKDPSALGLVKGTAVNCLLIDGGAGLGAVAARAEQEGFKVARDSAEIAGVSTFNGEWPGVKLNESGRPDRASAGPTGAPWVDSNGWKIRLTASLHPGVDIWVSADPGMERLFSQSYLVAVADAAAHGGRWIISLDTPLAAGLLEHKPESLDTWKKLTGAAAFFAEQKGWSEYQPEAVLGVISDFSGSNEFLSHEILNLVARTNQQYAIIPKSGISPSSFTGLRALLYTDDQQPEPDLRRRIIAFVEAGGMLITGPNWGQVPGTPAQGFDHPRFVLRTLGKGRLAVASTAFEDPYLLANDSVVLISHRHELLRFWNGGAVGSYFTMGRDRARGVVQMVFYAPSFFGHTSLRVAGRYQAARLRTLEHPAARTVEMERQKDAIELHLPPVSQYAAVELEVQAMG